MRGEQARSEPAEVRDQGRALRVLALDWGKRRIGVAVSDELGIAAHGLPTLLRRNIQSDLDTLADLVRDRGIETVIVGRPLHMDGTESPSSDQASRFARRLAKHARVRVEMRDERLTSWEARQRLGPRPGSPGDTDQMAAVLLLEGYLVDARS